jgi:sterol desaturase/sphingolipid hydroxylase (fatty acid hydroxylase superfamily)
MVGLVLFEMLLGELHNKQQYKSKDLAASLSIGIGNLIVSAGVKIGLYAILLVIYNILPWKVPAAWWSYPLCLIAIDFCRYWGHRVAHEQRFWWATHVTHHSSEQYNFSVSFRLSWTQHIKLIFFLPAVMIGFHPVVFFICHQIEVLYQFWIHTEFIKKLPAPIEYIFTTPSHHRVHHAINERYIDKNYGSTFIIWDRIFGTFKEEDEKPVYGITEPVGTYNPVKLVFHEWQDIFRDVRKASGFKEKLKMVFGRPSVKS